MKCKFNSREHQVSYDGGVTWKTDEVIKGSLIESQSQDCPDDAVIERWVVLEGAYICDGTNKYKKEALQISHNGGVTWYYSNPYVIRYGEFISIDDEFCNNKFVGHYIYQEYQTHLFDPLKIIKCGNPQLTRDEVNYYPYSQIYSVSSTGTYTLSSCTIGDCVTSIDKYAFMECGSLESIDIPNSVTSIGYAAFDRCSGLTSCTIGSGVTSIGNDAFRFCSSLTSCTIGSSVTSIGRFAFYHCSGLTSIDLPSSVTSIGDYAFYYCNGLTSCTIGSGVTSIGGEAFYYCNGLTSIDLPSSVRSIGDYAFNGCSGLTSITVNSTTPPTLGSYAFNNTNCPIYVPAASINAYKAAWPDYESRIEEIQ